MTDARARRRAIPLALVALVGILGCAPGIAAAVPPGVWVLQGGDAITPPAWHAVPVILLIGVAVAAQWLARDLAPAASALALVGAAPLLGQRWLVVLAWLLVALAGVVLLVLARRAGRRASGALAAVSAGALALAWLSSWASIDTWWYASVGAVGLLVAARGATDSRVVRGVLLGVALVLAVLAAGAEGWHVRDRFGPL